MLLALNATDAVDWAELVKKVRSGYFTQTNYLSSFLFQGKILACHLAKPLSLFREHIAVPESTSSTKAASPAAIRSR